MKRILFIVISALFVCNIFANINYIDINKISKDKKYIDAFDNIKNNQNYYAIWYYEWNFDISKEDIVNNLKKEFDNFSSIKSKNIELYLLLGDIAHFLYNLEVSEYNNIAVENYNQAIKLNPNEYRAYWFMATHYSQMGNSVQAMEN
ncbi:MAG: hypothetical protein LBN95_04415, partial [Prevotellaceae bacterium]|nr:hypothetical protein [Prevotellaceae bacterium]